MTYLYILVAALWLKFLQSAHIPSSTDQFRPLPSNEVDDNYVKPAYKFGYSVYDPYTLDMKSQWEHRDGDLVRGAYSLLDPDGTMRIVEYISDKDYGFRALVKKIPVEFTDNKVPEFDSLPFARPVNLIQPDSQQPIQQQLNKQKQYGTQFETTGVRQYNPPVQIINHNQYNPPNEVTSQRQYNPQIEAISQRQYNPQIEAITQRQYNPPIETISQRQYNPHIEAINQRQYNPPRVENNIPKQYRPQSEAVHEKLHRPQLESINQRKYEPAEDEVSFERQYEPAQIESYDNDPQNNYFNQYNKQLHYKSQLTHQSNHYSDSKPR